MNTRDFMSLDSYQTKALNNSTKLADDKHKIGSSRLPGRALPFRIKTFQIYGDEGGGGDAVTQ